MEYDVLLVDLNNIFRSFETYGEYNGLPRITDHDSIQLKLHLKKRKTEIKEFLESGKNIIVLGGNDDCVYCYTGKKDTSGTGKNAKTTYYVEDVHSISLLPVKVSSLALSGKRISFKNKKVEEQFERYNDYFEYRTVYENVNDNILMTIEGTNKVVSYYEQVGKGKIIFFPDLGFDRKNPTNESRIEKKFLNDISNINNLLLNEEFELPAYSKKYLLPNEEIMMNDIDKSKCELNKLLTNIENKNNVVNPEGTVYFEANSATGSKYYQLIGTQQNYIAARSQSWRPTYSVIDFTETTLTVKTYDAATNTELVADGNIKTSYTIVKSVEKEDLKKEIESAEVKLGEVKAAGTYP